LVADIKEIMAICMSTPDLPPTSRQAIAHKPEGEGMALQSYRPPPAILVVDDDDQIRRLLESVLKDSGFQVYPAGSAQESVEEFHAHRREIVLALIDLFMPNQNGIQALGALRSIDNSLCCCFVTGGHGQYSIDELFARGAAIVFHKPFDLHHFTRAMSHLVFGPYFQSDDPKGLSRTPFANESRRFPRWLGNPQDVLVAPLIGASLRTLGTVINRSLGGLSLVMDEPRECGSLMRVRSMATVLEKWLAIEVRHVRADGKRWVLGCRFLDPPALSVFSIYG
jgi:CheY-like chemotaxis protein